MFALEKFQDTAVTTLMQRAAKYKRLLLQSATGSGKTVMAAEFIRQWMENNPTKNVVIIVSLQCLITQFEESLTFHELGDGIDLLHDKIKHKKSGDLFAKHCIDTNNRILLTMPETMVGTMEGRAASGLEICPTFLDNVGLLLIDEAHNGTSLNFQKIRDRIEQNGDTLILGLTATPGRAKNDKGECLAVDWDYHLVNTIPVYELIELGRLVQPIYFTLDESGDCYRKWLDLCEDNNRIIPTIWVCRQTKDAIEWERKLMERGEKVGRVSSVDDKNLPDGSVDPDYEKKGRQTVEERAVMIKQFESGELHHLVSVMALSVGFDAAIAECVIVDRCISHPSLWQQIVGRVLRKYEGKKNGFVIDRGGNLEKHGAIEGYIWSLDETPLEKEKTVKVGNRKIISFKKAIAAKNIQVTCETKGCVSRYNRHKHASCPNCKTLSGLKVETSNLGFMKHVLPDMSEKVMPNAVHYFKRAAAGDTSAMAYLSKAVSDYILPDGTFNQKYDPILGFNPKNLKEIGVFDFSLMVA